jgi:phage tail-like protein
MDANGVRFWMLADGKQFDLSGSEAVWDDRHRVLRLLSQRQPPALPTDREAAGILANQAPVTLDAFGTFAALNTERTEVLASGVLETAVSIFTAAEGQQIFDLCMGEDSVLYLVAGISGVSGAVVMVDRRDRWSPVTLTIPDFIPDRIVARSGGGAWALDRSGARIATVKGMPLRRRPLMEYQPDTGRPCQENPDPPRLTLREDLVFPADHDIIAMAANPHGQSAVLLWPPEALSEAIVLILDDRGFSAPITLTDAVAPFSLGWAGAERWAVLLQNINEAMVYQIPGSEKPLARAHIVGDRYPLKRGSPPIWSNKPFCNGLNEPVYYQASADDQHLQPRPLHRLSMPALSHSASVAAAHPFDGGEPGVVWHRIYLEASLPPGTGLKVWLAAAEDKPDLEGAPQMEHQFGTIPSDRQAGIGDTPIGSWVKDPSEIPFHPGLLHCPPEKGVAGLFTALIQRAGRRVRTLRGRYLQVRLELFGNGLTTPEVAALRIYAPRFSYLDRYLPALYRETEFGPQADALAAASGADFLQRYLCLFECLLTPIEDKVAAAHVVTDPQSAPPEALEWLSGWLGLTLLPGLPEDRRRRMLNEATWLYRKHGTLPGLALALDIATGELVTRGDIVILEDFRLRRTFATILGADLADEEDPLMMGIVASGNSYVGETLFLGQEEKQEFLALFLPETAGTESERDSIQQFFERLAHRVTVLVHHDTSEEEFRVIRRVAEMETPAHVQARILSVSKSLLVGLSSLVGVDTYLRQRPPRQPVRAGKSFIGRRDYIQGIGSLDPRLDTGPTGAVQPGMRRPIARASDTESEFGRSFYLDASRSEAFGGRSIEFYHWTMKNRGG